VDLRFTAVWDGGFVAAAVIRNPGTMHVRGWQLRFGFDGNIDRAWNGVLSRSGRNYAIANEDWYRWIAPGDSVFFGFEGTFSGKLLPPDSCTFNGNPCTPGVR
jgi:xyloglucan-specific exo-beta-1,4-glucanase